MNLDSTTKLLQIVLGEAMTTNDCDITASYADSQINNFSLGNQNVKSNGTTPVAVVDAPVIDTQRQVKEIRLFNNDTVPHNVTLQLFDGTDTWIIGNSPTASPVAAGGSFVYTPESGVCCSGGGGGGTSLTVQDDTGDTISSVGTLEFVGVKVSGSTPSAITNMTTITGPDGIGGSYGTNIKMTGGLAGPGGTLSEGGNIYLTAGSGGVGGSGTYSFGGSVNLFAGSGGSGTGVAIGGGVVLLGGNGGAYATQGASSGALIATGSAYGVGNAGRFRMVGGNAYGSGHGGEAYFETGGGLGGGAGGNLKILLGPGTPNGVAEVNHDPSLMFATYSWIAGEQLNNQTIFTTTRAMLVTAVIGRLDAANGAAGTLTIVKAASGTAPSGGTALTSDSVDLDGTPDTNQTLTLSATLGDITLAPGDSLCMTTTGTLTLSAGCITVWGTPQ